MAGPRLSAASILAYERCLTRLEAWCRRTATVRVSAHPAGAWHVVGRGAAGQRADAVDRSTPSDDSGALEPPEPLSMSTVDQTWAAMAWQHLLPAVPSPTDDPWVKTVRRGLRRALAGHRVRKAPPLSRTTCERWRRSSPLVAVGIAERALLLAALDLRVSLTNLSLVPPSALELMSPTERPSLRGQSPALACAGGGRCGPRCLFCALWSCAQLVPPSPLLFGVMPGPTVPEDYGSGRRLDSARRACGPRVVDMRARSGDGAGQSRYGAAGVVVLDDVADGRSALPAGFDVASPSAPPRTACCFCSIGRDSCCHGTEACVATICDAGAGLPRAHRAGLPAEHHIGEGNPPRCRARRAPGIGPATGSRCRPRPVVVGAGCGLDRHGADRSAAAHGALSSRRQPHPAAAELRLDVAPLPRPAAASRLSGFTLHSTRTGFAVTAADTEATRSNASSDAAEEGQRRGRIVLEPCRLRTDPGTAGARTCDG